MALVNAFGALALDQTLLDVIKAEDSPAVNGDKGIAALTVRQQSDAANTSADGDYAHLLSDEEGRLKVSTKPASFALMQGDLTTASSVSIDVSRCSNVVFHLKNTGTVTMTAGTFVFEASVDSTNGADGNWFGVQAIRSNSNTVETQTAVTSLAVNASPTNAWECSVNAYAWFRIRASVAPTASSIARWTMIRGSYATEPIPAVQFTTTQNVAGSAAHAAAISGNPIRLGARALTADYTAVATGQVADLKTTLTGALITKDFAIPEADWFYTAQAGGITVNTDILAKVAPAAGLRNYITAVQLRNASATQTEFVIKDGATVIWRSQVVAGTADGQQIVFPTPLRCTAATAVNINCLTAGAAVYANLQGFVAP